MGYKWAQDSLLSVAFVGAINFCFAAHSRSLSHSISPSLSGAVSSSEFYFRRPISLVPMAAVRFVFHMHIYFSLWFHFLKIAARQIRRHTDVL